MEFVLIIYGNIETFLKKFDNAVPLNKNKSVPRTYFTTFYLTFQGNLFTLLFRFPLVKTSLYCCIKYVEKEETFFTIFSVHTHIIYQQS